MLKQLDGPAIQFTLSGVTTTTPVEVKAGATAFSERQVVSLQGDAKFYVYFANDGETPTVSDITTKGFTHPKDALRSYEASSKQTMFVLSVAGTVNIRGAERG